MPEPIVVAGITDPVGRRVADELLDRGRSVRGITHRSRLTPGHQDLEVVETDLTDPGEVGGALEGSSKVYLAPPASGRDPLQLELAVVESVLEAARATGVDHLIAQTILHADREITGVPLIDKKAVVDKRIQRSPVPHTILRPGFFPEILLARTPHEQRSTLHLPFAPGHDVGLVGAPDMARAAVALLDAGPQHRGFDLHLPEGASGEDLAQALSRMLDREIEYVEDANGLSRFLDRLAMGPDGKRLYEQLLAYARAQDYVGEPREIEQAAPGFEYGTLRSTLHETVVERRRPFGAQASSE